MPYRQCYRQIFATYVFIILNIILVVNENITNCDKNIKIYILNMPDESLSCYDEIKNFLDMGWIELYKNEY